MKKNAVKPFSARESDLIEMLRENPELMNHIEELALMTRDPDTLQSSASQAEEKVIGLCRGIGKSGLQKWAEMANEQSVRSIEEQPRKGKRKHGKKNSTG